jgi:E3 ubiquitin-protein ligase MUL1
MIVGRVQADHIELSSNFAIKDGAYDRGVVRILEIKEHGTTWRNNISSDTTRLISRLCNTVSFSLLCRQKHMQLGDEVSVRVGVNEPLRADYLLESLETTYTKFQPVQESLLSRVFSNIFSNESIRGVETTEHMLKTGTELTAFGKLERRTPLSQSTFGSFWSPSSEAELVIDKPTLKNCDFILTTLSRAALVERMRSTTRTFKLLIAVFGAFGVGLAIYCAYKRLNKLIKHYRRQNEIRRARKELEERRRANKKAIPITNGIIDESHSTTSACVVCLENPREVVLLDCGHVCMCISCMEQMPAHNCPICRRPYRAFLPCYVP